MAKVVDKVSGMDISFIGQPHEWDPRRLYSQTGADWQHRVDFDRLRGERLDRLRAQMKADDLGALVLFAGANIRYATASYQGNWKYNINMPALEAFQQTGLTIVNGWPTVSKARTVKTRDEVELLKQASSIGDAAMWKIKYEWLKPGVREREIEAKVHEFMLERGCEIIYDIIVASGGNTSPYRRWATDKLIRQGDLVIVDINAVGPSGYFIDFVRCFKCGGAQGMKLTQKEIDLYREVYDSMYAGLEKLKPGNTTADVAAQFPEYDDDKYGTVTLQQFAH